MKIIFTGDFSPLWKVEKNSQPVGYDGMFGKALELFAEHDELVVNLECPLTETVAPRTKTGPSLISNPQVAPAMARAGVTVASLANEQMMQKMGRKSYETALQRFSIDAMIDNYKSIIMEVINDQWEPSVYS